MKKLLLLLFMLAQTPLFSQELFKGDKDVLDVAITLRKIPAINVLDKNGDKFELDKYLAAHKLHVNKPFLLVLWGNGEKTGVGSLNELALQRAADLYTIVAVFIDVKVSSPEYMNQQLVKADIGNKWDDFLVLSTSFDEIKKGFYLLTYPQHIYANSSMEIITTTYVQPYNSAKIMLDNIQAGLKKDEKIWYTKDENITNSTADTAAFYKQYIFTPEHARVETGTKNTLLSKITYHIKGGEFLYDGDFLVRTETGQITEIGKFSDGIPLDTVKSFYDNGKVFSVYPVNGIYKIYNEAGEVIYEGPIVNGLGNGTFIEYTKGKKIGIFNYNNGIRLGMQQKTNENGSLLEYFASSDYETKGYLIEGLQQVEKNKLRGYADRTGKMIIPFQYDYAQDFKDGKAAVRINEDSFHIDKTGQRIKEDVDWTKYDKVYDVIDGIRRVRLNNKYGYVTADGKVLTGIIYDDVSYFSEGMAVVEMDKKTGFINTEGTIIVPLKYRLAEAFLNGKARVALFQNNRYVYGYIDKTGKEIIPVIYGLPKRSGDDYVIVNQDGKYGMLDWKGNVLIPTLYEYLGDFSQGRAVVKFNGKYGFIDINNKAITELRYNNARDFKEGMAAVMVWEGREIWGFINLEGKEAVILQNYGPVENFNNGLAKVYDTIYRKWGMVSKTGKVMVPFEYNSISPPGFSEDLLALKKDDKWGAIDRTNKTIVPFIYDDVYSFADGVAVVEVNKEFGFVNKNGEVIIPIKYDGAINFQNGVASVKKNGKWVKINKQGVIQD